MISIALNIDISGTHNMKTFKKILNTLINKNIIYSIKKYKKSTKTYHLIEINNNLTDTSKLLYNILHIPKENLFNIALKLKIKTVLFPCTQKFNNFTSINNVTIEQKKKIISYIEQFTETILNNNLYIQRMTLSKITNRLILTTKLT